MKRSLLSKTIGILGLVATLSAVIGTNIQQAAQAQIQNKAQLDSIVVDPEKQSRFCAGDYSDIPEQFKPGDGTVFVYDFMGIDFSPEQEVAHEKFTAELNAKADAITQRAPVQQDLANGSISFTAPDTVPDEVTAQMDAVRLALSADLTLTSQQRAKILNERFGQYGEFAIQKETVFTPDQVLENKEMDRKYQAQMLSIFTPDQQKIYLENLKVKNLIGSCGG